MKIHPTEKPVSLIQVMIDASSNAGDKVLDAFAGSGSTLEAAIRSRRIPKGYELEKAFYDGIRNRLVSLKASLGHVDEGHVDEDQVDEGKLGEEVNDE